MDSTNSGSIQSSSSDGDDDYDSRPEAISSFLNLPPPPPPPPPSSSSHHLHHHPSPSSFISLSPFFNSFPSTPPDPNPLSLDMPWAKSLPSSSSLSDPSCTITGGLTTTNSSSSTTTPSFRTMAVAAPGRSPHSDSASLNPSSVQPPTQPDQQPPATPRASKKRSRASRRAPTTVLTTDTSNFRAMVQEFTGFPAAPFISSPFSRPRLDLFHATAAAPPYLLRPFAQKVQTPLFSPISSSSSSSSSMADVAAAITRNSVANANTTSPTSATCSNSSSSSTTSSSNYQLLSMDLGHPNLLRSPNFTFQSPLRPPTAPNQSSSTMPAFGGNPPLGASDYAAGGLGSLITMEGTKLGGRAVDGFLGWDGGSASEGRDQSHLRPGIANYGNLQLVSSHAEKGSESMTAARGEGRVDSWILSSD